MKKLIALLSVALAACGGGGSGDAESAVGPLSNNPMTSIFVIGNSITYSPPAPSIGWLGSWGMGASSQANDFAHLTASAMGLPVTAINFNALEVSATATSQIATTTSSIDSGTVVVVQLADNVPPFQMAAFMPAYNKLLDATRGAARLVCIGSWAPDGERDDLIKTACTAHRGTFVYIGDIKFSPDSHDNTGPQFDNSAVNSHPHDWGMAQIANRVLTALK